MADEPIAVNKGKENNTLNLFPLSFAVAHGGSACVCVLHFNFGVREQRVERE